MLEGSTAGLHWARLVLAVSILAIVVSAGSAVLTTSPAAATTLAASRLAVSRQAVVAGTPNGADPAEIQARDGQLGYHEHRLFPYAMVVVTAIVTIGGLLVTHRWREPERGRVP